MILSAKKITKSFTSIGNRLYVFKDLSFEIDKNELVTIVGPSGSGKSTLLNILGTLDSGDKGTIHINGVNISKMNDDELA